MRSDSAKGLSWPVHFIRVRCGEIEHCPVVYPLCELIEGYTVSILREQFFVLEASNICSNMSSLSDRRKRYVLLCLLSVGVWTTRMNEVHGTLHRSSCHLAAFFSHQLKFKIKVESYCLQQHHGTEENVQTTMINP